MAIAPERLGIGIARHFTRPGEDPYDTVTWERRDARITHWATGAVAFEQLDVEVPSTWSLNATNILAQKYFRGTLGTPERESSLKQVADRVVDTICGWGVAGGYFVDDAEAEAFSAELKYLIVHQKAAFNSPVWFNIGVAGVPQQGSACQPYGALVSTPEGLVPIGRLVETDAVGAKVYDAHGLTKVVAVKANGRKPVLRLHTKAGATLDVTADHLVWRASGYDTGSFVPAGQLRPGDKLSWHRTESWGDGEISMQDVAEAALAGWLQSDGFVGQYDGTNRSLTVEAMTVTPAEREWVTWALDRVLPGQSGGPFKLLEVERIEHLGEDEVYDIQTESGEYLSGNLRVHNCFILSVEDSMESILNWYREEGIIFKGGSGAGVNLSRIRSSQEGLRGGGTASGPVSFMRGADASAGTIKCLHEDTPIVTTEGVRPIREVTVGSSVPTRSGLRRVIARHDNGVRPLVRVRTALGEEIRCTPEHRFWARTPRGEGWVEAGQLRSGDAVLLDASASDAGRLRPLEGVDAGHHNERVRQLPEVLDEPFALWLGWIYGDGSVTSRPFANFISVQLGDKDSELESRYRQLSQSLFGDVNIFASRHADKADASASVRFCSTQVIRFLECNGLRKERGAALSVPELVAGSPAAVRAAFLAGLFEADGHVGNGYVWFSSVSERLALGVQRLLHSLGIPAMRARIDDRATAYGIEPIHTVRVIGGEGQRRFAKLVGFISERKSQRLDEAMARRAVSPYETQWQLPYAAGELDRLWQRAEPRLRRALAPYCRYETPRKLSLLRARALLDRFPNLSGTVVGRFAEGNEFWAEARVEADGVGRTFDLTVEDVHEYLVHNLVTHNSGGKTRRAAKMVILDADHPDVEDFIWCKATEERKARALRDAGFDMDLDGKDSHSIQYQNANNSVRVTDEFMQAVVDDDDWHLRAVSTGEPLRTMKARDLFRQIAKAAWECADPGMQFDTTINRWHTAANTGRINASNPCSEYMHLDNSACNLASLNLLTFLSDDDVFDVEGFKAATQVIFTAQEIIVGNADYPTEAIAETSRRFRQLGIGYANLGALLMAQGMAYDSDGGRALAAAVTSLLTGCSYQTSARTAARMGPFAGFTENREPMLRVLRMHRDAVAGIDEELVPHDLLSAAQEAWDNAVEIAEEYGVRNAQASVMAPTGCLVGGSLVATERGLVRLASLGDPQGEQWQDLGVDVATDEGPRPATKFFVNGLEAVVTAATRRGYRIQGTPQHRIKVVDPGTRAWHWKRFAELTSGDLVPLALDQLVGGPQRVPLPPLPDAYWTGEHETVAPREMTAELAELVGYFMGDGSLHSRGLRFCVTDGDADVVERLVDLGKRVFHLSAAVAKRQGYTEVRLDSVRLTLWWEACGFAKRAPSREHHGKGYIAFIPDAVLHANDRRVYGSFIRGLYEADGDTSSGYPTLKNTSIQMVRDTQALLLALGCPTALWIRERTGSWGRAPVAGLRLLNSSYNGAWLDEIGFMGHRKSARVARRDGGRASRGDWIPMTRELVDRLASENDRLRRVLLMELNRGRVSRHIATELFERTADPELGHLLSFFYDRIETTELGDDEFTYDLSVPDNVTYIANGFISHNTIGLLMDCDTTGIEPDLSLVKTKKLVGGGTMSIVNQTVPRALRRLGYDADQVSDIVAYIDEQHSIVDAPRLAAEHLPVFACSMGDNVIHYRGHIRLMGAIQPFISGALSKTVNLPEEATVEEVEQLHIEAWRLGLKAVAIYRDNCKVAQPLATAKRAGGLASANVAAEAHPGASEAEVHDAELALKVAQLEAALERQTVVVKQPIRERLPRRRPSQTFGFRVADCEGYVTVGEYDDGRAGEVFMKVSKQGSTLAGIMDAFAISVSLGLQHGVPLSTYVKKYTNMRFEPAGMTDDPDLRIAQSLVDYIFRRLAVDYLPATERAELGVLTTGERMQPTLPGVEETTTPSSSIVEAPRVAPAPGGPAIPDVSLPESDAPYCYQCGVQMQRSGSCHACPSCGTTSGCS